MDKKMINAVAGSGKTTYIINSLNLDEIILILTYTQENQNNLRKKIIEKYGVLPKNISVSGYFEFIFTFCLRPLYKPLLSGINFDFPGCYEKQSVKNNMVYSNRLAKLINDNYKTRVLKRIARYFDKIFVDEVQDLTSDDFDFVLGLSSLDLSIYLLGDYNQSTFMSSARGNKGKGLRSSFDRYEKEVIKYNYEIDKSTLSKSYRCGTKVCEFVSEKTGIKIESEKNQCCKVEYIKKNDEIEKIINNDKIKKLFYQKHY